MMTNMVVLIGISIYLHGIYMYDCNSRSTVADYSIQHPRPLWVLSEAFTSQNSLH